MPHKRIFWFSIIFLLISLACGLASSLPRSEEPVSEFTSATEAPSTVRVSAITTGGVHACALLSNGKVRCWGSNDSGQLGSVTALESNIPVEVPNLDNVVAISAGGAHSCAMTSSGEVKCWGENTSGQLGDGTKDLRESVVTVSGLKDVVSISAGTEHTCAILKDGTAKCWGKNLYNRVGSVLNDRLILTPAAVNELHDVIAIAPGGEHTCALTIAGTIKCWGNNGYGQVGDDTTRNRKSPTAVANLTGGIKSVATGYATSCALTQTNSVVCWGWIGLQSYFTFPQPVDGLQQDIIVITAGADHICGLTEDGVVKCLGENEHGQLGNGSTQAAYTAKNVDGLGNVASVAASFSYTCALVRNGEVFCWGDNSSGQLGNGTNTDSSSPVQVVGLVQ